MRKRWVAVLSLASTLAWALLAGGAFGDGSALDHFERRIRPVLIEHCYPCHSQASGVTQGGLRLDTAAAMRRGGDSGPVLSADTPDDSPLLQALRYEGYEMPPSGKLPDETIAAFAEWIAAGAHDPREGDEPITDPPTIDAKSHWSFQPIERPEVPQVESAWVRTPIDAFVTAKQREAGVEPAPAATSHDLLRRVYFDLTGLPPTAAEIERFQNDPSDEAYEAIVDALLASPRFGERWGRYWLDVARYADTKGYVFEEDRNYPNAYRYRDWVIASFNDDLPYDQFLIAQIAADQLGEEAPREAMGYLTLGRRFLNNPHDIIDDRIDVVTRGMLGLTVACARCHDHKYDPIPTADYYSLYSVFASSEEQKPENCPPVLVDRAEPVQQVVFLRGNPGMRGEPTPRQFLECVTEGDRRPFEKGSGRRELAEAIASPDNPLTARVWANRVWGWLFGRGLVATASDFGLRGEAPTHPELLDHLATALIDDGWSTKRLVRRIVLSSVYRQSCEAPPASLETDPGNTLLTRRERRRLDLEASRDAVLQACGRLDLAMGGPSQQLVGDTPTTRRAVYGFVERQNLPAFFRTFDFPSPDTHASNRAVTVSPQQALYFLNSPLMIANAAALAEHSAEAGADEAARVEWMFRQTQGRRPSDAERADLIAFLTDPAAAEAPPAPEWSYGWGRIDEASVTIDFHVLPHFKGDAWQGGPELPDPSIGWVMLNAGGGHPGDTTHQAIRRWTAPAPGDVTVAGKLSHGSDQGDGVRARVVHSVGAITGEWTAANATTDTGTQPMRVAAGDTIDFVVDCRESEAFDSFGWDVTLNLLREGEEVATPYRSTTGFEGPAPAPLDRWGRLAQVLLMSNEFQFVD
ncbi:PSD1 and planctomycete cytochrome C domain-containing protein [Botrimarina mediterranea]|uniref:PSD1 and planctomycete cytochrome C domain-containing protein n=1 Tax=Botrimarina mediterranea TaxID=2528022 RepID=UPI00118A651F|nr:Planctomycete cytochrome C [Planctomycetes bacterium K2D]